MQPTIENISIVHYHKPVTTACPGITAVISPDWSTVATVMLLIVYNIEVC